MLGDRLKIGRNLQQQVLGVYFHDLSVCVAWMDDYAGRQHLLAATCVPCADAVVQGQIVDKIKLAEAIGDALEAIGAPSVAAIACVADEVVMTTTIELPEALSDEDVEAQIVIDAERYIGRPLDEVYFDFQILSADDAGTMVSLTVAHRAAVDDCIEVLAMAGLETRAIDVASLCKQEMAARLGDAQMTALMDIDAWQIRCYMAKSSFLWMHSQPLDPMLAAMMSATDSDIDAHLLAKQSSPMVAQSLDFSQFINQYANADESPPKTDNDDKRHSDFYQIGFDESDGAFDHQAADQDTAAEACGSVSIGMADSGAIERLGGQIAWLINVYQQQYSEPVKQVFLMGIDERRWSALAEAVSRQAGTPCQFGHPKLLLADSTGMMTQAPQAAPLLMMPTMLALRSGRGVNLLPWRDERRGRAAMRFRRLLQASMATAAVLVATIFAILTYQINHQNAINAEISSKIASLDDQLQQLHNLKNQLKSTEDQLAAIDELAADRSTVHRWQMLPLITPDGVYFDGAKQTGDELLWTGKAVNAQAVSAFANALELSGIYSDVLVVSLQQAGSAMSFSISATKLPLAPEDMQTLMVVDDSAAMMRSVDDVGDASAQEGVDE